MSISILIIARNEERNIAACLRTVAWADEIVVVDTGSNDATIALARQFTANVFSHPGAGFSEGKRIALESCTGEWVLWLDADERVTDELAAEIRRIITVPTPHNAFEVARRAFFLGRWIKHCGWYPGHVTRLFRRGAARFSDHAVHERLIVDGSTGRVTNDLLHYTDDSLQHYFAKFNDYTSLAADDLVRAGTRATMGDMLFRPPATFLRMYVVKVGFLDGIHGFIICLLSAFYVFTKYAKTRERFGDFKKG